MLFPFDDCLTEEKRFGFIAYSICSGISGSVPVLMNVLKQVLLWILYVFFCLVFAISLCASVYMCFVVTCWERADLLAFVCGVEL